MSKTTDKLLALTGPAVLLNVRKGGKAPSAKQWEKLTLDDMGPRYLADLKNNIGVSLGKPSGGLHTIDCDDEPTFARLLELNPTFADTLQTHGKRGGNFWLRIEGEAPKTAHYFRETRKQENRIGEWRGTGGQTIIYGQHPSGMQYRNNAKPAATMRFAEIVWPDNWWLPWQHKEDPKPASEQATKDEPGKDPLVVETMLMSIPPRPDYDTWLKLITAVRSSLDNDDQAIALLKKWSPEETEGEYADKLKAPLKDITFGTLFHYASEHGFAGAVKRFFYNTRAFGMQGRGGYVPLTGESAVRQHLAKLGVPKPKHDAILCDIRETQYVDYIGALAGHLPGLRQFNGSKLVVTSAPKIVPAAAGDSTFIDNLFRALLHDPHHPGQLECFLNWLAHCRRALLKHRRTQTPAVAMAGYKGDGKSLGIEIINRSLGGRAAKGYGYLSGDNKFNSELIGAELLYMDDDSVSKDHRARVRLAQAIKANQFAGAVRAEGKNKDAFTCDPVQAIVMAVNCDPEELRALPELTDSMEDKICLLKTRPAPFFDTEEENSKAIDAALPAFLHQLEQRDMSEAYDSRRRLKCFWHPEIVEAIGLLSPERQLLELIHQLGVVCNAIMAGGQWSGTAADLEGLLTDREASTQHNARRLLSWGGACGTYLGRLADARNVGVHRGKKDPRTKIQTYIIAGAVGQEDAPLPGMKDEDGDDPF